MAKLFRRALVISAFAIVLLVSSKAYALNVATVVPADGLNFRTGPGFEHSIIRALPHDTPMYILADGVDWVPVRLMDGREGWVSGHHIVIRPEMALSSRDANSATADRLVAYATQFVGTPYVYGGSTPAGFDCSGFTQYVYRNFGFSIGRTAQSQLGYGRAVERSDIQKGDLVFYGSSSSNVGHVAIYIGDGQVAHARTTGTPLSITSLEYSSSSNRRIVGIRRLL